MFQWLTSLLTISVKLPLVELWVTMLLHFLQYGQHRIVRQALYTADRGSRNMSVLSSIAILPFSRLFLVGTEDGQLKICCWRNGFDGYFHLNYTTLRAWVLHCGKNHVIDRDSFPKLDGVDTESNEKGFVVQLPSRLFIIVFLFADTHQYYSWDFLGWGQQLFHLIVLYVY